MDMSVKTEHLKTIEGSRRANQLASCTVVSDPCLYFCQARYMQVCKCLQKGLHAGLIAAVSQDEGTASLANDCQGINPRIMLKFVCQEKESPLNFCTTNGTVLCLDVIYGANVESIRKQSEYFTSSCPELQYINVSASSIFSSCTCILHVLKE